MLEASEAMEFERAASLRDKIRAIKSIAEKQKMANMGIADADVIAFVRAFEECLMQVFFIRSGKMTGRENFTVSAAEEQSRSEVLTAFVKQFYSGTAYIPKEINNPDPEIIIAATPILLNRIRDDQKIFMLSNLQYFFSGIEARSIFHFLITRIR